MNSSLLGKNQAIWSLQTTAKSIKDSKQEPNKSKPFIDYVWLPIHAYNLHIKLVNTQKDKLPILLLFLNADLA